MDTGTLIKNYFGVLSKKLRGTGYRGGGSFMFSERRALGRRFNRPTICLFVHPSYFCPEHISKDIEGSSMKLDTLIEGHEGYCRMQSQYLEHYLPS